MFLVYYIIFMVGTPCMYNFLWKAIQEGEMLGAWQKVLEWLYSQGHKSLEKFLGGCEVCFSHFISWVGIGLFILFTYRIWPLGFFETLALMFFPLFINWFTGLWLKQSLDIRAAKRQKLELEADELERVKQMNDNIT